MTTDWVLAANACFPLRVEWTAWEDPTLVLKGSGWSFASTSAWRLRDPDKLIAGCEDEGAGSALEALARSDIVKLEAFTTPTLGDVRLVFSNGRMLEVFVAGTIDPWVFRLPNALTIVPSPTDPEWSH